MKRWRGGISGRKSDRQTHLYVFTAIWPLGRVMPASLEMEIVGVVEMRRTAT
jgi:hypothetical protein